ncbi:MAG TPA: glycoside hydrolase family 3 C-terminal domain-containing protein, partial [Puia sp.]|nr:glycoside hydrolase family 3 C-terminal domain-containing protein [Puia sp.]
SWTMSGDSMARYFSGTAEYETTFGLDRPGSAADEYQLDLGDVREVAEVSLNGHELGTYWCYPYQVNIPHGLLKRAGNILRIKVTNLDANRIIWMDRQKIPWKNFFFVDITYSPFDASGWAPVASGLLGKVRLRMGRSRPGAVGPTEGSGKESAPGTGDGGWTQGDGSARVQGKGPGRAQHGGPERVQDGGSGREAVNFDFLNPALPIDERVEHLVGQMTLEEKVGQLVYDAPAIRRLKVPAYNWWNEGLHGVARAGQATVFPQAIAMAASFDKALMWRVGDVISTEARAKNNAFLRQGKHGIYQGLTFWSPNINIYRDPRWGRGQETYGEDPFLTSAMAVSYIRGMQGNDPHYLKTVATAKHFAVHSGPEPLRHAFNAQPSPKDLWETYLPAFRAAVQQAGVQSVMCAYNRFMGDACCGSSTLLQEILRDKWHFSGYVVSDCWAIKDFWQTHKVASDATAAAIMALRAGTDLNCGVTYPYLVGAVRKGMVEEKLVDQAVTRLFKERFALGLFDPVDKVAYRRIPFSAVDSKPNRAIALQMARESIVLLKNEHHILPLSKNIRNIAVIGPLADDEETLWADYSGYNKNGVTLLRGIRDKLPNVHVRYVTGCELAPGFPQVEPIPAAFLYGDSAGAMHGVTAEYFANASLSGKPVFTRRDGNVDFLWWDQAPDPRLPADSFSVRWKGYLKVPETGEIALGGEGFNSYRLWINDSLLVDFESVHHPQKEFRLYRVHKGEWVKIKIEYRHHTVNHALMRLLWSRPVTAATEEEALDAARDADVVILAMGLNQNLEGEEMDLSVPGFSGGDRTDIGLPAPQEELVRKVQALGKPTVLVLLNGGPVSVTWEKDHIDGIVEGWYDGQSAGTALADVLFGDYNPAGRMPVTVYRSVGELPSFDDYAMKGRTYRYFKGSPLYEFGYGLSYTHFRYSGLRVAGRIATSDSVEVKCLVENDGQREGDEVVQLYVRHEDGDANQPIRSLKGFQRIHLKSGEKKEVRFLVNEESLSKVTDDGGRVVAPGIVSIGVGGRQPDEAAVQSGEAVSARLRLTGPVVSLP